MKSGQKIIDLLAMSRFANLPTVWSNALLGVMVGWSSFPEQADLSPLRLVVLGLALSFLYLGGCFLNDWHDEEFDRRTRPDRPIPSGRFQSRTVLLISLALMGAAMGLVAFLGLPAVLFALGLVICILLYTRWHKKHPLSLTFMAGARVLIYPLAAFSLLSWSEFQGLDPRFFGTFFFLVMGLGGYILGISLTARAETSSEPPSEFQQIFPILLLCAPVVFLSAPLILLNNGFALPPLGVFIIVLALIVRKLRDNHQVGPFVSRTLAAIPLVDFLLVVPLAPHAIFWFICPALALLAWLFQKLAPAT